MKWMTLICLLALSTQANAVSMENKVFALEADEIRFRLGEVTAKRQVIIRIKSPQDIQFLASKTNVALSSLASADRSIEISLAGGWVLQGRIKAIFVDGGSAILEADEIFLQSRQLLVNEI